MRGCRCKVEKLDGTTLSRYDWEVFERSPIWKAFLFEIDSRREFLSELLINGSQLWNDEQIKGRIHELEYFRNIPEIVRTAIQVDEENTTTDQKE